VDSNKARSSSAAERRQMRSQGRKPLVREQEKCPSPGGAAE